MISDIEAGLVKRVIIKDMSRFGRDYLQVGMYTEIMFPEHDIHFIAVNDGVDSTQGDNDFTPLRNIIKEMVVEAAFELTREGGEGNATVKNVAKRLGCSVQPIYSYCESMEGLRQEVALRANDFVRRYVAAHLNGDDLFRATGLAHLALAREEPHIFRLFISSTRNGVASLDDLYRTSSNPQMAQHIARASGISEDEARALHLHMLIYTVGVGAIAASALPGIPEEELIAQLESALQAFTNQRTVERKKDVHGKQGDSNL